MLSNNLRKKNFFQDLFLHLPLKLRISSTNIWRIPFDIFGYVFENIFPFEANLSLLLFFFFFLFTLSMLFKMHFVEIIVVFTVFLNIGIKSVLFEKKKDKNKNKGKYNTLSSGYLKALFGK